jgi:hypothetical protein
LLIAPSQEQLEIVVTDVDTPPCSIALEASISLGRAPRDFSRSFLPLEQEIRQKIIRRQSPMLGLRGFSVRA